MDRSEKERLVAELTERLKASETMIVADYRGLTVTEIDELRTKLIEHGARFSVVKNTLTKRAAESAGVDALLAMLEGPTAIAFLESDGDPVAVAKALDDAAKAEVLVIKGGLLDGAEIAADDVKRLAKLPPTDTLRAQLVGCARRLADHGRRALRRADARHRRGSRLADPPARGAGRDRRGAAGRSRAGRGRGLPRSRSRGRAGGRHRGAAGRGRAGRGRGSRRGAGADTEEPVQTRRTAGRPTGRGV